MLFIDTISVINLISSLGYAPSKSRVNIKAEMDNIHLDNKNTANPCAAVHANTPIDLCTDHFIQPSFEAVVIKSHKMDK